MYAVDKGTRTAAHRRVCRLEHGLQQQTGETSGMKISKDTARLAGYGFRAERSRIRVPQEYQIRRTPFRTKCAAIRLAAKSAPHAKRNNGPKLFAAANPTKYSPSTDDSKSTDKTGELTTQFIAAAISWHNKVS